MQKDNLVYVEDILNSCNKILSYTRDLSHGQFLADDLVKDAVVRNIEILGEAANRLDDDFSKRYPEFPVRDAVTMRNKLIHGYDFVDFEIVWETIRTDIPSLKIICEKLLN